MSLRGHAGFSLIEVAVSLLLISISTLGLAGLQISAKHLGHQASQRTEAIALAGELLERMRANRGVLSLYAVEGVGDAAGARLDVPGTDCRVTACSAQQLSAWDLWEWEGALNGVSTGGSGGGLDRAFACVSVRGGVVEVEVNWEGFRERPEPEAEPGCGAGAYGEDGARRQFLRLVSYLGEDRA